MSDEITVSTSVIFDTDDIRVVGTYDQPWFIAKDICKKLGLSNVTMALKNVPSEWRGSIKFSTFGGVQDCSIINEAGLYSLIIRSHRTEAERFRKWICEDVLPSIRKKGQYELDNQSKQKLLEAETRYKQRLLEQEQKLQSLQKENKDLHRLVKRKERQKFRTGCCIYLLTHSDFKDAVKIGKSKNMNRRKTDYKIYAPTEYTTLYHRLVPDIPFMEAIENIVLFIFDKHRFKTETKFGRKREWFRIGEELTIEMIQTEIDNVCDYLLGRRQKYESSYKFDSEEKSEEIVIDPEPSKTCVKCKKTKILDAFYDRKANKDGKENLCKLCYVKRQLAAKKKKEVQVNPNPITKTCRKCKENLSVDLFKKHSKSRDGYTYICRNCLIPPSTKTEKKCSACKEIKPISEFNNCSTSSDGKFAYCRPCNKIKNAKYKENRKKKGYVLVERKLCIECHENKDISEFWKHPTMKDGHSSCCKSCYYIVRRKRNEAKNLI